MQGLEQASNGRDAGWPLTPAQEHKFDALAAFDAGQLQEAQHAFDLSVWSDMKTDRGGLTAALLHLSSHFLGTHAPGVGKDWTFLDVPVYLSPNLLTCRCLGFIKD